MRRAVPLDLLADRDHYEQVTKSVLDAEQSVWIATANLKELMVEDPNVVPGRRRGRRGNYRSVLKVFADLAKRGVELRILHASMPSRPFRKSFDAQPELVEGALEMRMCPRVHLKTVVIDARLVYLGSANWTGAGLGAKGEGRRNFEMGILTSDEQIIDQVQERYDRIWRGSECAGCRLRDQCEMPLDEM
ncbi:MAG: phospholipase D family protein [Polyangiales bacterium]|jgi:phosphatidylserine/phosphatidylglycerophosphate/cardiolipin synthase-like enzyme